MTSQSQMAIGASAPALVSLDDAACEGPALAGNKAATLALLRRAGFEVPPGVVLSTDVLGAVADDLPAGVHVVLQGMPRLLGPGPWAVRSSSTAEDTEQASFAGQFETVLNVDQAGLADAVVRCFRSGRSDRVVAYAGDRTAASMAVLIQPMIPADAAGVAFTADPVTGKRRTVIEAVTGLGERLVSGAATPERWTLDADGSVQPPSGATVLDDEQARAIGALARRVEEHLGRPQDIEWAIADGLPWLLQARPITTLPSAGPELIPIPIEVPPGDWEKDTINQPAPFTPFVMIVWATYRKMFAAVASEFGILIDRFEHAIIGGWLYSQIIPVGAPPPRPGVRRRPSQPPHWLLAVLMRVHPAIRRRTRAARQAIASDLPYKVIRQWFDEWRPMHQEDTHRALAVDLGSISDADLTAEFDHRIEVVGHPAHAMVAFAYFVLIYQLGEACQQLLGWGTPRMLTLLEGLSTTSAKPARQLSDLAELARHKPAIRELLAAVDENTPARLAGADAEFAAAFSDYVEANGHRSIRWDVIDPNLAETPHLLLRLVADQLAVEFSPDDAAHLARQRREQAADEARRLLAGRPEVDRRRFERALSRAREAYPAFEDRVWWTQSVQWALLRYLALEIGRRLVDRGQLAAVGDVFFLEAEDALSALSDNSDRHEIARIAQGRRAWATANPGPLRFGNSILGEPPFDLLPPPARLINRAVMWGIGEFYGSVTDDRKGAVATGTPASAGRYTGSVRVVMDEQQFSKITAGDVVVCPVTSPAWSVVFPSMGALVTDTGGILSHPAIIARELGIPAVVGTGNATQVLEDGQRVTVDGHTGIVELAERADLLVGRRATSKQTEPLPTPPVPRRSDRYRSTRR